MFLLTLQVQRSLNNRLQNFDNIDNLPSAPHDLDDDDEDGGSSNLYPSLHNLPTMPRYSDITHILTNSSDNNKNMT